jgi:hypothetical protein
MNHFTFPVSKCFIKGFRSQRGCGLVGAFNAQNGRSANQPKSTPHGDKIELQPTAIGGVISNGAR